jgi:hypothetical protein
MLRTAAVTVRSLLFCCYFAANTPTAAHTERASSVHVPGLLNVPGCSAERAATRADAPKQSACIQLVPSSAFFLSCVPLLGSFTSSFSDNDATCLQLRTLTLATIGMMEGVRKREKAGPFASIDLGEKEIQKQKQRDSTHARTHQKESPIGPTQRPDRERPNLSCGGIVSSPFCFGC